MHGILGTCGEKQQVMLLLLIQIIVIVLMGTLMTYGPEARPVPRNRSISAYSPTNSWLPDDKKDDDSPPLYPMYQDVHVMIWIGFGFLMTFLRRYGQSAVGLTFLVGAILVQVAMLCEGVFNIGKNGKAPLSLKSLLSADVAVAAPLISMGALLGKTTYMQLIVMGIIELIVYTANKYIGENHFVVVDAGDSMYVHAFGAYFGLAVSFVFGMKEKPKEHSLEGSSYESDIFAMIGTVFLWLFWPSFNSAALKGDEQRRAIINTLLSIAASCVISFAVSAFVSKQSKFNMVHVQNSTLAGGVAIGTAAGMMCEPFGALAIGSAAGAISVLGYKYLTPLIQKRLRIHDTCGVHNLHGMPAVLAGLFGALLAGLANEADYNYSLYEIFPGRIPGLGPNLTEINENYRLSLKPGPNRSAGQQAAYQLLALAVTIGVAIVSGLITGLILRMPICGSITEDQKFDDSVNWEFEDENAVHDISSASKDGNGRTAEQLSMGHI
ncbi:ammonium transporter Rh type A isoform X4 [Nasonia vitripennis]|uniref:Ammonium transporter AmtB-like domain-containing protein n=1 Tax=Nasonia vitripennis TaxID=7425 RepID=A0A7M7HCY5_NASVI|nr:ammonium transporter Rh type A isoform X4 [Nasonia vitripennis]